MNKVFFGDCREVMQRLIDSDVKVQTCVTSPPYYGLRDYGHDGQIGLEPTPDEYVATMVKVFRLVRDLLADDGTLWLNLGDSYAGAGYSNHQNTGGAQRTDGGKQKHLYLPGLKPKDLIGIPWRVAFALQADGWYLRQDIIWHKPNPMPESVTDRCTKAHEYIFLMSKNARYYFDGEAIAEASDPANFRESRGIRRAAPGRTRDKGFKDGRKYPTKNKRSVWTVTTKPYSGAHFAIFPEKLIEPCIMAGSRTGDIVLDPFFGSGTTGQVAQRLGRDWIGIELNEDYSELQDKRTAQQAFCF